MRALFLKGAEIGRVTMIHCISIDWLALFCSAVDGQFCQVSRGDVGAVCSTDYEYKIAPYGTRQFRHLAAVSYKGDLICEVQYEPCSSILRGDSVIVKFANRLLYQPNLWLVVDNFLRDHSLAVRGISRVDVCADFNKFETYEPVQLVSDFLASKIRHKGKGIGAAYFNHFGKRVQGFSVACLQYSGLTFGSRESDARAYLYNKSLELRTQTDKPYIRNFWKSSGLNTVADVWRLEISIKSGGVKFRDKRTGDVITYDAKMLHSTGNLCDLFYTYAKKLFSFVVNRPGITNITREPLITLFAGTPKYEHGVICKSSCSSRTERILLKQLWQMADNYRGRDLVEDEGVTKTLAMELAESTDLKTWLMNKASKWERPQVRK